MKTIEVLAMFLDEWPTCYEISFSGGHWHFIRLSVSGNEYPKLPTDIVDSSDCDVKVNEEEWKSFKQDIFYDCEILNPFKFKTPLMALAGYLHRWPEEVISIRYIGGVFYVKDAEGESRAYPGENLELAGFVNLVDDGRELTKEDWSSFKRKCITYHIEERKLKEEHKLKKTTLQVLAENLKEWPEYLSYIYFTNDGRVTATFLNVSADSLEKVQNLQMELEKKLSHLLMPSDPGTEVTKEEWLEAISERKSSVLIGGGGNALDYNSIADCLYNAKLSCLHSLLNNFEIDVVSDKEKSASIAEAVNAAFDAIK